METILTKGHVSLPIDHEIRNRLESGRGDSFLVIVPTAQARLKLQRECLAWSPNRVVAGLHIHTLEDLVQRFYRRIGDGRRQISPALQMMWMRQITNQERLRFFNPPRLNSPTAVREQEREMEISIPQGTVERLTNAINQLKASGVDPSQLREDVTDSEGTERDKLADLIAIYEAYERKLGRRWIDRGGLHRAVSNYLSNSSHQVGRAEIIEAKEVMAVAYPNVDLVLVRGFDVFSPPDLSILTGIASLPQIGMCIVLDFDAQNESLFGHVKEDYDQLLACGFKLEEGHTISPPLIGKEFTQNLFRKDRWLQSPIEKLDLTELITFLQVPDRTQEVEQITRLIKQLALDCSTLELHRICVAFYNFEVYAPLIREIFPLYGIPHTLDLGGPLANSPLVSAIFSLLDTIGRSANPRLTRKTLQSPYFSIDDYQLSTIDRQFKTALSPEAFRKAFENLMEATQVRAQILRGSLINQSIIVREISAYRCFQSLIEELVDFLVLEYGGERRYALSDYTNWLRLMVSQTPVETLRATFPPIGGGVYILPLVQTKDLDFDIVILGGLVDGEFPATFRPDAFLHPKRSRTESDRLREDRFLFYQALKLFRKHLYLIAPQRDGEVELIPSAFIGELQRIAEIEWIEEGREPDESEVSFSEESFLKHYGKFVWEQAERIPAESGKNENVKETILPPFQSSTLPSAISPALYLISHNLRVEKSRTITHDLPQYEGQLAPGLLSPSSRGALTNRREGVYSISQLESYGRCPFQFFSNRVLRLNLIEEEEDEGLTNREKGDLLHAILFEFYDRCRDKPPISECTDTEFEAAAQVLRQIAQKHLEVYERAGLFWEIDVERLIGGHGKRGILPTFLDEERERKLDVHPCYFEVGFGPVGAPGQTDPILSSDEPITVGEASMAGKIDRIELGDGIFTVGDYKTGSLQPKIGDILEGRSLQLPIYIFIVERLLNEHHPDGMEGVGGVYYVLREDGKAELGIGDREYNGKAFKAGARSGQLLPNPERGVESMRALIDFGVECANQYVHSIANGEFPLTPHDKGIVCRFCPLKRICRVGAIVGEET